MSKIVEELLGWIDAEEEDAIVGPVKSRAELAKRNGMMTVLMSLAATTIKEQQDIILDHDQSEAVLTSDPRVEISEQNLKNAWSRLTKVELLHERKGTLGCKECRQTWPCRTARIANPAVYVEEAV